MGEDYRFGIEEEYFVNDAEKRDVARSRTRDFFDSCRKNLPGDIQREMLEPQVEVATPPSGDFAEARRTLAELRRGGRRDGGAPRPRGDGRRHPSARRLEPGPRHAEPRYGRITHELQMIGSRNVVCGLHVHVEVPDRVLARRPHEPAPALPAAPSRALDLLALLAGPAHRASRLPARRLSRDAAHLAAATLRRRGGLRPLRRHPGPVAGHRGRELPVVGGAPLRQAPDAGAARRRLVHAPRRHAGGRRPVSLPRAPARPGPGPQPRPDRRLPRDRRRELLAGPALRHPRQLRGRGDPQGEARRATCSARPWPSCATTPGRSAARASSTSAAGFAPRHHRRPPARGLHGSRGPGPPEPGRPRRRGGLADGRDGGREGDGAARRRERRRPRCGPAGGRPI